MNWYQRRSLLDFGEDDGGRVGAKGARLACGRAISTDVGEGVGRCGWLGLRGVCWLGVPFWGVGCFYILEENIAGAIGHG